MTFNEDSPFTTRTMSLIKIISHFYVSTITPGSLKLITDYERFLLYIIIASSAMNYNKKIDKNLKNQQNLAKVWYNININPKKEMNDYDNETKRII